MSSDDIRKTITRLEEGLITQVPYSVKLPGSAYELVRTIMKVFSENYHDARSYGDNGVMIFHDEQTYNKAISTLKSLGIQFEEVDSQNLDDFNYNEGNDESPYPKNNSPEKFDDLF